MNATVAAPDLRLLAPTFAGRFAVIIAGLVALIARAFLHDPKVAPLIIPLYRRLNRTARGIATLMAGFATDGIPQRRARGSGARTPKPAIPTAHAWLVRTLGYEAAGYASQLSHLLNEPGVPELLAATPTAGHLLRPLCRMLGIPATALGAVASDPATGTQLCVPKAAGCAPSRTESPDTPLRGLASPATGVFDFPESAATPSRTESATRPAPPHPPPPCPHLRYRWPWFQPPRTKPA